jgi:cytochrome c556
MLRKPIVLFVVMFGALAGCGQVEDTRPGQPVKTRQAAFKEMLKVFEPMGTMLRSGPFDADRFAGLTVELMTKREVPWIHFGADTNYPPTKAKAVVWSQAEQFATERKAFMAATDELSSAAQTRQVAAAEKAYFKVYEACQSCHKRFKEK